MSFPRIVAQVAVVGVQILGKAAVQATRQALRNARAAETSGGAAAAASSSNPITAKHKMALDEACNILNIKQPSATPPPETELQALLKNYEHLFKVNEKTSIYLQSKVVRAKQRIEAEFGSLGTTSEAAGSNAPPKGT